MAVGLLFYLVPLIFMGLVLCDEGMYLHVIGVTADGLATGLAFGFPHLMTFPGLALLLAAFQRAVTWSPRLQIMLAIGLASGLAVHLYSTLWTDVLAACRVGPLLLTAAVGANVVGIVLGKGLSIMSNTNDLIAGGESERITIGSRIYIVAGLAQVLLGIIFGGFPELSLSDTIAKGLDAVYELCIFVPTYVAIGMLGVMLGVVQRYSAATPRWQATIAVTYVIGCAGFSIGYR